MRTALVRHNTSYTIVPEEEGKAVREGRLTAWGGRQGGVADRVGWLAGQGAG